LGIEKIIEEIRSRKNAGHLSWERLACAHCGNSWIELVGLVVGTKEGSEDLCLRVGMESEECQKCRFRPMECQKCGSKDVYEITFPEEVSFEKLPLSFKGIRKVSRGSSIEST